MEPAPAFVSGLSVLNLEKVRKSSNLIIFNFTFHVLVLVNFDGYEHVS